MAAPTTMRAMKKWVRRTAIRGRWAKRKLRRWRKRVTAQSLVMILKWQLRATRLVQRAFVSVGNAVATIMGTLAAAILMASLPEAFISSEQFRVSDVHLACAGIIGTAVALVLSLSIIPAQRAADVFSSAILRLYARDRTLMYVFALLSAAALASVLLGTNWNFGLGARETLAAQLVLLGMSLDAIKWFYRRALDLLVPATALEQVRAECDRHIARTKRNVERLVRIHRVAGAAANADPLLRAMYYSQTSLPRALAGWMEQLEELAHKAIARRDTQAANGAIATMAKIGMRYADSRRDSLILLPDFTAPLSEGTTDISKVLSPVHESIRLVCEDAAKQSNEAVVRSCLYALAQMAAQAMTIVKTQERWRTAPLAHAPVFYLNLCVTMAIKASMEDALLTAIDGIGTVFAKITADVDTSTAESTARECLYNIALTGYARDSSASCFAAVEMMLRSVAHELHVRGFRSPNVALIGVLEHIATLVPLEVAMEKAGKRVMQTIPPYSLMCDVNIPKLIGLVAQQVKPVDRAHAYINQFRKFNEASEQVVRHYRKIAQVPFDGTLLRKWVVDSLMSVAQTHLCLLANPPTGSDRFLDTVKDSLQWVIYTVPLFFCDKQEFPRHHANDAAGSLACLGMALLEQGRLDAAESCGEAISAIAKRHSEADNRQPYDLANILEKLEQLARAAEVLGQGEAAGKFRAQIARPPGVSEREWPEYAAAIGTRIQDLDIELNNFDRLGRLRDDSVSELQRILGQHQSPARRE